MRLRPSTSLACASGLAFAVVVWSPGAMANGCDPTPSIGQTIVCDADATITVPDGARVARVVVIGGGGGSGGFSSVASGEGGNGAYVSADLRLTSTTDLSIVVGAGGSGGDGLMGGLGGQYSAVFTGDTPLMIAGGGGGGSSDWAGSAAGGSGAALGSAAGGDGAAVVEDDGEERISGGSGGNSDGSGNGGSSGGGTVPVGEADGSDWDAGGSGGVVTGGTPPMGEGGSGYGGGGTGGKENGSYEVGGGASGGGAGGSYASNSIASSVVFRPLSVNPGDSSAGAGGGAATGAPEGNPGRAGSVTITFFIVVPTPSNGSSAVAPRAINLGFTLPSGFECRFGSVEASIGSWIELPAASDCTVTPRAGDTSEGATLLGWATSADFPVAIAQRQVDNGWGAYETYNDDGQLTSVFIPAGGFTAISGPTNLFPIMK